MGIFIPSWVVIVCIVLLIFYFCKSPRGVAETLLSPFGLAPKQGDMVELAMRRDMFAHN